MPRCFMRLDTIVRKAVQTTMVPGISFVSGPGMIGVLSG